MRNITLAQKEKAKALKEEKNIQLTHLDWIVTVALQSSKTVWMQLELIYPFINHKTKVIGTATYARAREVIKNVTPCKGERIKTEKQLFQTLYRNAGYRYVKADIHDTEVNALEQDFFFKQKAANQAKRALQNYLDDQKNYGVYEIIDKQTKEVLYVGLTMTSFDDREDWHKWEIEKRSKGEEVSNPNLYDYLLKHEWEWRKVITNKMLRNEWYLPYQGKFELSEPLFRLTEYSVIKNANPRFNRVGIGDKMYR